MAPIAATACAPVANCTASSGSLAITLAKGNYFGTIKSSTGDNLSNALVMLLDGSGAVITDSLTNAQGVFYLNISDGDITSNSCTSNNVCDLKVQPASLAIGSAVDQDSTFQLATEITTGQTAWDLGSKILTAAS